jgi:hypothetical protein
MEFKSFSVSFSTAFNCLPVNFKPKKKRMIQMEKTSKMKKIFLHPSKCSDRTHILLKNLSGLTCSKSYAKNLKTIKASKKTRPFTIVTYYLEAI